MPPFLAGYFIIDLQLVVLEFEAERAGVGDLKKRQIVSLRAPLKRGGVRRFDAIGVRAGRCAGGERRPKVPRRYRSLP